MTGEFTVESVSVESLQLDNGNARKHSQRNIEVIASSLKEFGQRRPLVVYGDTVIAGNGTLLAAQSLGWTHVLINKVPRDWTVEQARAYAIADNRSAELADWDYTVLAQTLADLDDVGLLSVTGFTADEIDLFDRVNTSEEPQSAEEKTRGDGSMLALVDVSVDEPKHVVEYGDVYLLDGRHYLICVDVFKDWEQYVHYLMPGMFLVPYPEPYITLSVGAKEHGLVLVQPDSYLAGHLLDKHESVFPSTIVKQ